MTRRKPQDPFARLLENPPKQARSRASFTRLLDATEALLDEGGLDAATVPAIAARAGVSVGVVYQRFPDKDNLLRAVYQRFFERGRQANLAGLSALSSVRVPLYKLMKMLIHGALEGNRHKRNLIRSLMQYGRTHRDPTFRRAAIAMNRETMRAASVTLMSRVDEINHPNPEHAIEFALVALGAVINATVLEDEPLYSLSKPDAIEEELTRMVLGYLGIDDDGEHPVEFVDVGRGRLAGVILANKSRR